MIPTLCPSFADISISAAHHIGNFLLDTSLFGAVLHLTTTERYFTYVASRRNVESKAACIGANDKQLVEFPQK